MTTRILLVLEILLLMAACSKSESKPTEADAIRALQETFDQKSLMFGTGAKVASLQKLDGMSLKAPGGIQGYCIEYSANIDERGQRSTIYGAIRFHKTETGWVGQAPGWSDDQKDVRNKCSPQIFS